MQLYLGVKEVPCCHAMDQVADVSEGRVRGGVRGSEKE